MAEIIILFILKSLDATLSAIKNMLMIKDKYFMSAVFNAAATYFYLTMVVKLSKANSITTISAVCLATFLGSYIPCKIIKKTEKAYVYVFDISPLSNDKAKVFADFLRDKEIALSTAKKYNDDLELVLHIRAYSQSKAESEFIIEHMPEDFKYTVIKSETMAD